VNVKLFLVAEVAEDVVFRVAEDLQRHGVMVILQRRYVLIAQSQIGLRVYLIPTDRRQTT